MKFEWDPLKDRLNRARHGVLFEEAATVFDDPFALTVEDPDHSIAEYRFLTTGYSERDRLLIVWHTDREDRVRIIGAREVAAAERQTYEEGEQ